MAENPKDILEYLDRYEPPVDEKLIEKFIRDKLSASDRREAAVIIDGCATWSREYDRLLKKIREEESITPAPPLPAPSA